MLSNSRQARRSDRGLWEKLSHSSLIMLMLITIHAEQTPKRNSKKLLRVNHKLSNIDSFRKNLVPDFLMLKSHLEIINNLLEGLSYISEEAL